MVFQFLNSRFVFPFILGVIILIPHFITQYPSGALRFGGPKMFSGDEPHHYIILKSLLNDFDLDLSNNYERVHQGKGDAGERFRFSFLDHHSTWYIGNKLIRWAHVYNINSDLWLTEGRTLIPTIQKGKEHLAKPSQMPEYSQHTPGLAFILALPLFLFRDTECLESMAILFSGLAIVFTMLFFRMLISIYGIPTYLINIISAITILCSPLWVYGRMFFGESFLTMFGIGAYAIGWKYNRYLLAGILIALSVFIKPIFPIIAIPLGLGLLYKRKYRDIILFCFPVLLACLAYLSLNHYMHGSPFRVSQEASTAEFSIKYFISMLFNREHGLFWFSPVLLIALYYYPKLIKLKPYETSLLLLAAIFYYVFFSSYGSLGGYCYGPRYLIPIIPFLSLGLLMVPHFRSGIIFETIYILALCISFTTNLLGSIFADTFWGKHPLIEFFGLY